MKRLMIVKTSLIALLVPCAVYGNTIDAQAKIQDLKEFRSRKTLELADLGMAIAERKGVVEEIFEDFYENVTQEDKDAAGEFSDKIQAALVQRSNIAQVINTEFVDGLDDWKIFVIRVIAEKLYVENLIVQYAECFQAIIDNDKALLELQE
jgi:hypothetical protein